MHGVYFIPFLLTNVFGLTHRIGIVQEFNGDISRNKDAYHTVDIDLERGETLGIQTETSNLTLPLQFLVKGYGSIHHWQVPAREFPDTNFVLKTLCPMGPGRIQILVSSEYNVISSYRIVLRKLQYYVSSEDILDNIQVSPSSPAIFRFEFPPGTPDHKLVVKQGPGAVCSIVSIRPDELCPDYALPDTESIVRFGEKVQFQTMLKKSSLVITRNHFSENTTAINIIILAKRSDEGCYSDSSFQEDAERIGNFSLFVLQQPEKLIYISTLPVLGFYIVGALLAIILGHLTFRFSAEEDSLHSSQPTRIIRLQDHPLLYSCCRRKISQDAENGTDEPDITEIQTKISPTKTQIDMELEPEIPEPKTSPKKRPWLFPWQNIESLVESEDTVDFRETENTTCNPLYRSVIRSRVNSRDGSTNSNQHETDLIKKVFHLNEGKLREKRKLENLAVSDMCVFLYDKEAFKSRIHMRSTSYLWLTILMGIFYTLPVVQLVLYYQDISLQTGNLDICYYNFECLHRFSFLEDFGHVFSNLSYVISGIIFILLVRFRSSRYRAVCTQDIYKISELRHPENCGIPEQYGIFYSMGAALIMEGVLSACYHVCPTAQNFQFDTTFMYAISVLVFLKVFQFRHPDITQTAQGVFLVIGIALVLEAVGYLTSHVGFWIIFLGSHATIISMFLIHIYYNGSCPTVSELLSLTALKECLERIKTCSLCKMKECIPTLTVVVLNIGIAGFYLYKQNPGVSRYLLVIIAANMTLYVMFYLGNKLWIRFHATRWRLSEGLTMLTTMYGLFSILFMMAAMYFFTAELKSSAGTPAESRNLNGACTLGIFDNHDLWHFFSAAGLFFLFIFLLTLEENNLRVPRNRIQVF